MDTIHFLRDHEQWKYLIIFLLSVPEGPFLTVVCGFLVTKGFLNPFYVYSIMITGDIIGDGFYYILGRSSSVLMGKFGVTPDKIEGLRGRFENYHFKAVMASKLIHGPGIIGLAAAGALRVSYPKFLVSCVLVSMFQSAVLLVIGLTIGEAYIKVGHWLNIYAATMFAFGLVGLFIFGMYKLTHK